MPINVLEQHPFLDYLGQEPEYSQFNSIIIGSFPIWGLTDSIDPNNLNNERYEQRHLGAFMPFFYGSKTNKFWKRISSSLNELNPLEEQNGENRRKAAIKILNNNNFIITDILYRTNRKGNSPSDNSLRITAGVNNIITNNFNLNPFLFNTLRDNGNIKSIYFTAMGLNGKTPGGWFTEMLTQNEIHIININQFSSAIECTIFDREYHLFFLPTPSASRSIYLTPRKQHPMFVNYLQHNHHDYLAIIQELNFDRDDYNNDQVQLEIQYRKDFISQWWKQFLVFKNYEYDGSNPIQ